jgi:1,4-dihydroxy-2-naphthoyl-CoA hydrolase
MKTSPPITPPARFSPEFWNQRGAGKLPGHLGIVFTETSAAAVRARYAVAEHLMAPNGYLHAGGLVTLADTCCGYGCIMNLPAGAQGFTTIELKSNFLGTTLDGDVECLASPAHLGKTTQVWDAVVTHLQSGRVLAMFRCTQMVLYPKPKAAA